MSLGSSVYIPVAWIHSLKTILNNCWELDSILLPSWITSQSLSWYLYHCFTWHAIKTASSTRARHQVQYANATRRKKAVISIVSRKVNFKAFVIFILHDALILAQSKHVLIMHTFTEDTECLWSLQFNARWSWLAMIIHFQRTVNNSRAPSKICVQTKLIETIKAGFKIEQVFSSRMTDFWQTHANHDLKQSSIPQYTWW